MLAHAAYLWELLATPGTKRWKWGLWGASLLMLGGLVAVHAKMDSLVGPTGVEGDFRRWHITYLWLSTAHWGIALVLLWFAVGEKRKSPPTFNEPRPPRSGR